MQPGLAPLARRQLAAWEEIAVRWPVASAGRALTPDGPAGIGVLECQACGRGVLLETDLEGRPYRYTPAERTAMIVLHLRTRHQDLDPDR